MHPKPRNRKPAKSIQGNIPEACITQHRPRWRPGRCRPASADRSETTIPVPSHRASRARMRHGLGLHFVLMRPPEPCQAGGIVHQRRLPRAVERRRTLRHRPGRKNLRRLAIPRGVGRRNLRPVRLQNPATRRLLLHGARRRRHRRSGHQPHGHHGPLAHPRRPVGKLSAQPRDPHDLPQQKMVVARPRHARARTGRPTMVSGLPRV